jgi:hypothetical protein
MMSHHQNAEQKDSTKIANGSFENVAKLKYPGMTEVKISLMKKLGAD